jgi:glyoxalase family protein
MVCSVRDDVSGHAAENVTLYTQELGMRLVTKSVNQDDVSAYHLFGDDIGHAGTKLTFFDWPDAGTNRAGTGTIAAIALRNPSRASLDWWAQRFDELGVAHEQIVELGGRATLVFADPEGQRLELVAPAAGEEDTPGGTPWSGSPVPAEYQLRGLHAVRLSLARLEPTVRALTETMGFRAAGWYTRSENDGATEHTVHIFQTGPGGLGAEVHLEERPDLARGRVGIGGVHHVAFRTPNDEEQVAWRERLTDGGLDATLVIDRFYFHSVYFRGPYRTQIEAGLHPLATARTSSTTVH